MLSLSSSIVFSWLGLVAFLLRSPILLFAVAQIIKWNYCVCTNPMFFSFLSQSSWRKTRKLRKRFERMQRVRKKEKARNEKLHIFLHCFHCLFVFWEKCFLWLPWTAASWGTASRAMTKGVEGRKNPVISKRGRCAQTVRKGRDIKVEGGGELVGEQILQGRIKEAHKREMATKADSGN